MMIFISCNNKKEVESGGNCMSNHQASEQMIGYLYQVRYASSLLLENDNSDFQISIEKFDDIAFSKDDEPKQASNIVQRLEIQNFTARSAMVTSMMQMAS